MAEVVAIVLHGAEGYAAEAVDLEDELDAGWVCDDDDVGFFADADLVSDAIDGFLLLVSVQSEVVEATVGEAVAIICTTMVGQPLWEM